MRRAAVRLAIVVSTIAAAFGAAAPEAGAHGNGVIIVPRQLAGRPAPHLDASCESDYRRSGNARPILYRPRYDGPPATVSLITTAYDLWVCIQGLSRRPNGSTTDPYVSLVFDTDHNGGAAPDGHDINLALSEDGTRTEYRGNGTGFVPQPFPSLWSARTDRSQEVTWNAEFSIDLTKLGDPHPGDVIGFQVRHTSLVHANDFFPWPTDSTFRGPQTWGDLFFLGEPPAAGTGIARLDVGRITQGLEWDVAQGANRPYDFIAGKDSLVQARLYSLGAIAGVTYTACRVQRIYPSVDPAVLLPGDNSFQPRVFPLPALTSSGAGDVACWVPGADVRRPGIYQFSVIVQMAGGDRQTVEVGMKGTANSRAVRLMLYRWMFPPGHAEHQEWTDALNASAIDAMYDLQRVLPVQAGVGGFAFGSTPGPNAPGLRYFFSPTIYRCEIRAGETEEQAVGRCDATTRNNGDLDRMSYDQQSALRDAADGLHRDRIDLQEVLVSTPRSGGGQSCWSNSASTGSGLDSLPTGQSHYVPIQETEHCWYQVRRASPHWDTTQDSHSVTTFFTEGGGWPLANPLTRMLVPNPRGVMFWLFGPDSSQTLTNEGWEFDDLRTTLLGLGPPSGNAAPPGPGRSRAGGSTQLQIAFLMDHTTDPDGITLQTSKRLDDSTLQATTPVPQSKFSLVFRDDQNQALGTLPFAVTEVGTHDGPVAIEGQVLVADIPDGSSNVSIEEDGAGKPLFTEDFTADAPVVSNVGVQPGQGSTLNISWDASDQDSQSLTYSIYFQQHPHSIRTLVESGLTDESYAFDTSVAPGTADGVITVEASDGYNVGEDAAGKVVIANKAPIVAISSPQEGDKFVAGEPVHLVGSAYDIDGTNQLGDKSLAWSLDGEPAGLGSPTTLTGLKPGTHQLKLTAETPAAMTGSTSVTIEVLADGDQDGIPNGVESKYPCLSPTKADSGGDPDVDGLTSSAEYLRRTNPCKPDTDVDGWSDGDEVRLGGDPRSAKSEPNTARIFLDSESLNLGTCASPKAGIVPVQTSSKAVHWTVRADVPFLSVSGGGVGAGSVSVKPKCAGLTKGRTYLGHVGVEANGGRFVQITVGFRT